ncbi:MAG: hypothetical protein GY719_24020, partial [bacterium]|nr:hypothetical protein [bacterium]
MADFLKRIVAKARAELALVRPAIGPRFGPEPLLLEESSPLLDESAYRMPGLPPGEGLEAGRLEDGGLADRGLEERVLEEDGLEEDGLAEGALDAAPTAGHLEDQLEDPFANPEVQQPEESPRGVAGQTAADVPARGDADRDRHSVDSDRPATEVSGEAVGRGERAEDGSASEAAEVPGTALQRAAEVMAEVLPPSTEVPAEVPGTVPQRVHDTEVPFTAVDAAPGASATPEVSDQTSEAPARAPEDPGTPS